MTDVGVTDTGTGSRRRIALVLVALALLLPFVLSALVTLVGAIGGVATALWSSYLPGVVVAVAAALVAPVRVGPRLAVMVTGLAGVGTAALFAMAADPVGVGVVGIGLSAASLTSLPALAWLGRSLGGRLHPRLDRAWRASLLTALVLAGVLLLTNLVTMLTYGAVGRGDAGVLGTLVVQQALSNMLTVTGLHLVTCAFRSIRALDGGEPPELRPGLLVGAHVVGALLGVAAALATLPGLALID